MANLWQPCAFDDSTFEVIKLELFNGERTTYFLEY